MSLKHLLSFVLIFALMAMLTTGCGGGATGSASTTGVEESENTTGESRSVESMVAEVEAADALELRADGTVDLKPTESRSKRLSPEAESFARTMINELNTQVMLGDVKVSSDFSVTPTKITRLPSFVGWRWWGAVFYFSHKDIDNGVAGVIGNLTLNIKSKSFFVTAPVYASLYYACATNGHRGAYLHVTWIFLWSASPSAG